MQSIRSLYQAFEPAKKYLPEFAPSDPHVSQNATNGAFRLAGTIRHARFGVLAVRGL